ncbi:Kinesin-like protein kif24, partial [Thoreauomyces humboldtii]
MNQSLLLETLRQVELDQYFGNFSVVGINDVETLVQLTMQDYGIVGVHSMEDRKPEFPSLAEPPTSGPPAQGTSRIDRGASESLLQKAASLNNLAPAPPQPQYQPLVRHERDQNDAGLRRVASVGRLRPPSGSFGAAFRAEADDEPGVYRNSASQLDSNQSPRTPMKFKKSTNHLNAYGMAVGGGSQNSVKVGAPSSLSDRIRVCVRKRPLNSKERKRNESDIAAVNGRRTVKINEPKVKVDLTKYVEQHEFIFDEAFDSHCTNDDVYRRTAFPLVEYIFGGGKATGQTGSGKTFTMLDEKEGLYVKAGRDIFATLEQPQHAHLAAWGSFYEIYQGHLYDLLNARKKLFAREDANKQVCITGLTEHQITDVDQLMGIFEFGNNARSTGATGANADSSRSHAIFQLVLKPKKNPKKIIGKLSFIDLAGSERGADRGETDKQTRMEGSEINKSLLALKECIRALDLDSKHTPFRQSKLTQVLKDSFIGNSRTCMIATISPNISNSEHTLNTLRYADRVKELKGDSHVGDHTDAVEEDQPYPSDHLHPHHHRSSSDLDEPNYSDVDDTFLTDDVPDHPDDLPTSDEEFEQRTLGSRRPNPSEDTTRISPPVAPAPASGPALGTRSHVAGATAGSGASPSGLPRATSPSPHHLSQHPATTTTRTSPPSAPLPTGSSTGGGGGGAPDATAIDAFVRAHRSHIREITEMSRIESKLLVNLTMRMGGG